MTSLGRISRPATVTVDPNPYPAVGVVWMNCGRKVRTANVCRA
jgi:hypothetical protein